MTSPSLYAPSAKPTIVPVSAPSRSTANSISTASRRAGITLSIIAVLFLLFDSTIKLIGIEAVAQSLTQLGYPVSLALAIGLIELICITAYVIPRTSFFGAILLTGYLGGAVATHVRISSPLFSHVLFPIYVGLLIWGGLYLRDARLRDLIPFRR